MRLKTRFIILGVICSIFFISFKIIEPELEDGVRSKDSSVKRRYKGKSKDAFCGSHDSNELIEHFVRKYAVQWNLSVSGSLWQVAAEWVTPREIHPEYAPEIGAILHKLSTSKVVKASLGHRGTQLKMTLTLAGGQRVAFKPKWYKRDDVVRGKPYDGPDRHNGEIVAFHLNRILGYRRAPLVVGRVVDMEKEIKPVAERSLLDTFYVKDGNSCFYGKCMYCKGPETGVCAEGTLLEGAVVLWLPDKWKLKNWRHPWGRTYRDDIKAMWETDNNYCEKVKQISPYDNGPRLMDIIDAAVFDYLIGNADRHHYETFKDQPDSMLIMLDSAKSFGNPYHDEESILAPLYQCCRIRKSTWKRLELLKDGVLSGVLCRVLSVDPISPLLADAHYEAMDRRLLHILQVIETCTDKYGKSDVLVVDRYSSQDEDDS